MSEEKEKKKVEAERLGKFGWRKESGVRGRYQT
jgi:hypothetical protein